MNDWELIGRFASLDERLKKLEGLLTAETPPPPPLSPQAQALVEAVEELMEAMPSFHLASAREKKRSELVTKCIDLLEIYSNGCPLDARMAISALRAFDKGGE